MDHFINQVPFNTVYFILTSVLGAWMLLGLSLYWRQEKGLRRLTDTAEYTKQQVRLLEQILNELRQQLGGLEITASNKLYVGNVDYTATEQDLVDLFSSFGTVEFVNIPMDKQSGRARGFGFVTFSSNEEAEKATSMNGTDFKGRTLQVMFAKGK